MTLLNTYTYEIKHSKFIAYYYEVNTKEEVTQVLEELKVQHKKARQQRAIEYSWNAYL